MNYLTKRCSESNAFAWGLTIVAIILMVVIALI
jgi:hypothetical protein